MQLSTFEQDLTNLIHKKLSKILSVELKMLNNPHELDRFALIEQLFDSITMGVILEEREVTSVLKLMYRLKNHMAREKEVSGSKLFRWMNREQIKKELLKKIDTIVREKTQIIQPLPDRQENDTPDLNLSDDEKPKEQADDVHETPKRKLIKVSPPNTQPSAQCEKSELEVKKESQENSECQPPCEQQEHRQSDLFQILNQEMPAQQSEHEEEQDHINTSPILSEVVTPPTLQKQMEVNEKHEEHPLETPQKEADQEHYTLLKLNEHLSQNEESNLMSDVSSYDKKNYLNLCHYQLEDTEKYGHVLYGDKIETILRSFTSNQSIFMLVKWQPRKSGFVPHESILDSDHLKSHCPQQLIDFYETC